jgi:hypothetical protein
MKKTAELDAIMGNLYSAAKAITEAAESLSAIFRTAEPSPQLEPETVTLEAVRDVLAEISRAGHTDKVRELLLKHGATRLSEIDPGKYATLLADARAING